MWYNNNIFNALTVFAKKEKKISMEITWLKNEDNAIQYVYASAVPQKIPLDIFKEIVQSSKENCLPEILCDI